MPHRHEQSQFWIAHTELPPVGHPFYERLNQLLAERGFGEFVESQCERFYAETRAAVTDAGAILSPAADRLFRRHRR
jgi:hypothetical protein